MSLRTSSLRACLYNNVHAFWRKKRTAVSQNPNQSNRVVTSQITVTTDEGETGKSVTPRTTRTSSHETSTPSSSLDKKISKASTETTIPTSAFHRHRFVLFFLLFSFSSSHPLLLSSQCFSNLFSLPRSSSLRLQLQNVFLIQTLFFRGSLSAVGFIHSSERKWNVALSSFFFELKDFLGKFPCTLSWRCVLKFNSVGTSLMKNLTCIFPSDGPLFFSDVCLTQRSPRESYSSNWFQHLRALP